MSLSRQLIIVGPPDVSRALVRNAPVDAVAFRSLDELDRWRESRRESTDGIGQDVVAVLGEFGLMLDGVPEKLRAMFESLAIEPRVPQLRELERSWSSRRSFYRIWQEVFDHTPSSFLRRVRSHHALRLLSCGCTKKEAALLAGYSSVDQMRRNLPACSAPARRRS